MHDDEEDEIIMSDDEDLDLGNQQQQQHQQSSTPWIEKYRPKTLDDIAHQEEVVQMLRKTLESDNLPHLLFYGPPGTGKTSTILAVARELFGPELMRKRVLELNASNERGIDVIRNKVKRFAQVAVSQSDQSSGYPCPPYKIIILDEADSMTRDAQSALRRTMEQYVRVTRFCIICNYVSRIIQPIASRCAKFRYKSLSNESMVGKLESICRQEGIQMSDGANEALTTLISVSGGDLRRAITLLQTAQLLLTPERPVISAQQVCDIAGVVPQPEIRRLLTACKANSFDHVQTAVDRVSNEGYAADAILLQFAEQLARDEEIADIHKAKIAIRIADAQRQLLQGADEWLQLMSLLSYTATTIVTRPLR